MLQYPCDPELDAGLIHSRALKTRAARRHFERPERPRAEMRNLDVNLASQSIGYQALHMLGFLATPDDQGAVLQFTDYAVPITRALNFIRGSF
ncbi:hypothetical protein RHOFW510R12_03955 [Rhodanobacter sp. FW510-R12]